MTGQHRLGGQQTTTATLTYSKFGLSEALIIRFAKARLDRSLIAFARGLTSVVYRIDEEKEERQRQEQQDAVQEETPAAGLSEYCVKRVAEEDEMAPHSVHREILCYRLVEEEQRRRKCSVPIASLLAAFHDETDPFSVEIDLVMPFYPCTLEEVMDEPLLQFSLLDNEDTRATRKRPSLSLAHQIRAASLESFVLSTSRCLFSALSFLHSCAIAHRDIKPSNILVDSRTLSIVLIDFGTCHLPSYTPGDDGKGGITSEVGTGAYRAPESLFSPLNGYSPEKVDIWQAGATLVQFFLPLKKVQVSKQKSGETSQQEDDRQEWEKALWADDDGLAWSQLEAAWNADPSRHAQAQDEVKESSDSGWKRETLFDASRGDLGLANSIFELRGLPTSPLQWPEAQYFQPSLERMPFAPRSAASGGLRQRLHSDIPASLSSVVDILDQCIQLSSSKRISADDVMKHL